MDKEQIKAAAAQQAATTTAVQTTKESAIKRAARQNSLDGFKASDVKEVLEAYSSQISSVLPKVMTADRMIAMASTEVSRNPALLKCTPKSLVGAVLQASILGFQPVATLGYCYFVPYGNDVQFQIGYKGMLDLARRSGEVANVYAEVVHEGDKFVYTLGLHRDLIHEPSGDISTPITHVYAVVEYKDGGNTFVVLSRAEVERLRRRSPMQREYPSGAWKTDYEAMAKAKAIKQLAKYLPLSVDTATAIASDEAVLNSDTFNQDTNELPIEEASYVFVDESTGELFAQETEATNQETK